MELAHLRDTVERCPQIGMCKVDFLAIGVCPAGESGRYTAYYPEGRMAILRAILDGVHLPLTDRLIDIVESCPDCDICDKQAYFAYELRTKAVLQGLRDYVRERRRTERPVVLEQDDVLRDLRACVGEEWATNDPAILVAYSRDMAPATQATMPLSVVMPSSTEEVAAVVNIANKAGIPFTPRASGGNGLGFALGKGIIVDVSRMKKLEVDAEAYTAVVGPGINSIELQTAVRRHGLRANTSEAHSHVCSNQMMTGIYSPFAHRYGYAGDNYIDAEIVTPTGETVRTNSPAGAHISAPRSLESGRLPWASGICTELTVKLHRILEDEQGVFVPFANIEEAEAFVRELGRRNIGLACAILSRRFFTTLIAPTDDVRDDFNDIAENWLRLEYMVMFIGDRNAVERLSEFTDEPVVSAGFIRHIILGLPALSCPEAMQVYEAFAQEEHPYRLLFGTMRQQLLDATPSGPDVVASAVAPDLAEFFEELYARPEMVDVSWLNSFRITSCRLTRRKGFIPFVSIYSLDDLGGTARICARLARFGARFGIEHMLGFVTPIESGRKAIIEYDFYFDPLDKTLVAKLTKIFDGLMLEAYRLERNIRGFLPGHWLSQGLTDKNALLYGRAT